MDDSDFREEREREERERERESGGERERASERERESEGERERASEIERERERLDTVIPRVPLNMYTRSLFLSISNARQTNTAGLAHQEENISTHMIIFNTHYP